MAGGPVVHDRTRSGGERPHANQQSGARRWHSARPPRTDQAMPRCLRPRGCAWPGWAVDDGWPLRRAAEWFRSRTQPRPGTGRRVLPRCRTGRRGPLARRPADPSHNALAGRPAGRSLQAAQQPRVRLTQALPARRPRRRRTAVPAEQGCRIGRGLEPGPVGSGTRPPGARCPGHGQPFERPAYPAYGPVPARWRGFQAVFAVHSVSVMAACRVLHFCSDRLAPCPAA
jgi:hypothetical protein